MYFVVRVVKEGVDSTSFKHTYREAYGAFIDGINELKPGGSVSFWIQERDSVRSKVVKKIDLVYLDVSYVSESDKKEYLFNTKKVSRPNPLEVSNLEVKYMTFKDEVILQIKNPEEAMMFLMGKIQEMSGWS